MKLWILENREIKYFFSISDSRISATEMFPLSYSKSSLGPLCFWQCLIVHSLPWIGILSIYGVHNTGGCTMMAMVTQFVCRPLICSAGKLLNCDHRNHPPSWSHLKTKCNTIWKWASGSWWIFKFNIAILIKNVTQLVWWTPDMQRKQTGMRSSIQVKHSGGEFRLTIYVAG